MGDELVEIESLTARLSSLSGLLPRLLRRLLVMKPAPAVGELSGWLGPATPNTAPVVMAVGPGEPKPAAPDRAWAHEGSVPHPGPGPSPKSEGAVLRLDAAERPKPCESWPGWAPGWWPNGIEWWWVAAEWTAGPKAWVGESVWSGSDVILDLAERRVGWTRLVKRERGEAWWLG